MSSKLVDARGKLEATQKKLNAAFEAAGPERDFNNAEALKILGASDSADAVEKIRALNAEMNDLGEQVMAAAEQDEELSTIGSGVSDMGAKLREPANLHRHADPGAGPKLLGDRIMASDAFRTFRETKDPTSGEIAGMGISDLAGPRFFNTLFETSAGWAPESVRSGVVVPDAVRPIQVLDIMPMGTTGQAAYVYMEETTRTHNAAEKSEGGTYAESAFALTEQTETVRKITDSVPVTDEQLEDVEGITAYLNGRLTFGLRQRADYQVLQGSGVAPNLNGILNNGSIQTQAKGSDPVPDAIFKAMTKIRVTGRSLPTHVLLHPNDWQGVRLLRTSDGIYIWGSPAQAGPEMIWGLPVVQTDVLSENTGLVGGFLPAWITLFERRGVDIQVGYTGSQFVEGKRTIRADFRAVNVIFRPEAFCTVTSI